MSAETIIDVYVRGHGIFRENKDFSNKDQKTRRDINKRHIYQEDLNPHVKLFFYGQSGYEVSGGFADSIILSQMKLNPYHCASKFASSLEHKSRPNSRKYICWPDSHSHKDSRVMYPHAIFSRSGWDGISTFAYPSEDGRARVLNYDIGPDDDRKKLITALIEITNQKNQGKYESKSRALAIRGPIDHKNKEETSLYDNMIQDNGILFQPIRFCSLYEIIKHYSNKFTNKFIGNHEIRIHWTLCRLYASNIDDTDIDPDYINGRGDKEYYVVDSEHKKPNATSELNQWLNVLWGS
ncbi:MAG: hypothetical protein LW832_00075 [Parachlamydia sp.]|jgi:hypothetical protein|nr:hypothetical protein [Parachlamydia sp.]